MVKKLRDNQLLIYSLLLMAVGYVLLHDLRGGTLFQYDYHDSYTLQALSWRQGRADLGQNYEYLELAIYKGKYFVSFPPLPSVVMLPLTMIFGEQPPSNMVVMVYTLAAVAFAYLSMRKVGLGEKAAMFWAIAGVYASNIIWISTMGGVWFMAQAMNMMLCLMAVYFTLCGRRTPALALAALAVGCRPFSAVFALVLLLIFLLEDRRESRGWGAALAGNLRHLILPAIIALAYMWYNYIRFDSPFEFGHNYLPEFAEADQFGLQYVFTHLKNLFFRGIEIQADGTLEFTYFDGFMFYLNNPVFILWLVFVIKDIARHSFDRERLLLSLGLVINLLLLTMHKTFGGWQFGARYTLDLIPYAFLYIALCRPQKIQRHQIIACAWGLMFNFYGFMVFLSQTY